MAGCGRLVDVLYKNVRIKMFAYEGGGPARPSGGIDFSSDLALRSTMEEAQNWDEREMRRRWMLGDSCYRVFDGPKCVHYTWLSRRRLYISEIGYRAELDEMNYWIYDSYTSPTHRGRSIFPRVLLRISEEALAKRGGIVWAGIQDTNASSIRGLSKAGFSEAFVLEKKTAFSSMKVRRSRMVCNVRLTERFDKLTFGWMT
jgi:hypothetical protein